MSEGSEKNNDVNARSATDAKFTASSYSLRRKEIELGIKVEKNDDVWTTSIPLDMAADEHLGCLYFGIIFFIGFFNMFVLTYVYWSILSIESPIPAFILFLITAIIWFHIAKYSATHLEVDKNSKRITRRDKILFLKFEKKFYFRDFDHVTVRENYLRYHGDVFNICLMRRGKDDQPITVSTYLTKDIAISFANDLAEFINLENEASENNNDVKTRSATDPKIAASSDYLRREEIKLGIEVEKNDDVWTTTVPLNPVVDEASLTGFHIRMILICWFGIFLFLFSPIAPKSENFDMIPFIFMLIPLFFVFIPYWFISPKCKIEIEIDKRPERVTRRNKIMLFKFEKVFYFRDFDHIFVKKIHISDHGYVFKICLMRRGKNNQPITVSAYLTRNYAISFANDLAKFINLRMVDHSKDSDS